MYSVHSRLNWNIAAIHCNRKKTNFDVLSNFFFQTLGDNITVKMYSPSWPNFDYTMVVIFVIAVFTVALGGYWSGLIEL